MPPEGNTKLRNVVGPQIRRIRYQLGWSQSKLALKLQLAGWDIGRSGVANIECRRDQVNDLRLIHLSLVLNISIEKLLPPIAPNRPIPEIMASLMKRR
jgi:transcriptional regulator with XRE-family HTH domain